MTAYTAAFAAEEPARSEVDAWPGVVLLEFGAPWCGHCQAAQPLLQAALAALENAPDASGASGLRHVKVEDGKGRPLGRAFRVKLWPTLVFLRNGVEVARLVRPQQAADIASALRGVLAQG